jgi:hypothetical protein
MPRTTPEQRKAFENYDRAARRLSRSQKVKIASVRVAMTLTDGQSIEAELGELDLETFDLSLTNEANPAGVVKGVLVYQPTGRGTVRLFAEGTWGERRHMPAKLKGLTLEQQCAMWQLTANDLEQRAIKVEKRLADLQREVRAALDGLDRDGAPAEILRRALEQSAARLHKRRRSSRKITPKGRR